MEEFDFEKLSDAEKAELMRELEEQEKKERKNNLNSSRDKELRQLTINNIFCTESNLFKMAVKHNVLSTDETVMWIDIDNNKVEMTKDELGQLIGMGAGAVEEIYLRYRQLKDEI